MKPNIFTSNTTTKLKFIRLIMIGLAVACLPSLLVAQSSNFPGGIIELNISKESTSLPHVKYGLKDVAVFDEKNGWRLLVGIDLKTTPGEYLLYIKRHSEDSSAFSQKFEVMQNDAALFASAPTDRLVPALYYDHFSDISFSNSVQPVLPLAYPCAGKWANYFGHIDVTLDNDNADARNYISLTTTELIPVIAPQNAIVSRIIENNIDKNSDSKKNHTLFLDHGRGLISIISGVTDITIETGNGVLAGAVLGKIYANNDSEPNTLIWQTVLNGAYVNPTILTQLQ